VLGYFERGSTSRAASWWRVAGNAEHAQVADLFAAGFEGWARAAEPHRLTPPAITGHPHRSEAARGRCTWSWGLPGVPDAAPERHALYLLNDILGGSMSSDSSRRFASGRPGLLGATRASRPTGDTGLFYVYAGTDPANFGKVMNALMKEIPTA